MSTLVYVNSHNKDISRSSLEAIACAQQLGGPIHILSPPLTDNVKTVLENLASIAAWHILPDNVPFDCVADYITYCMTSIAATTLIAASNTDNKQHLPKVAAMLDISMLSDVIALNNEAAFQRPVFAGDFIATMISHDPIVIMTIRPGNFGQPQQAEQQHELTVITLDSMNCQPKVSYSKKQEAKPKRDLQTADVIISAGRGIGNADYFNTIEQLANKMDAAIGATRTIVDAGWVANDLQVGQTGKIVAPNLYIAIGLSGAMQHLAGIKDSKHIIAINTDPDAPVMQFADYSYQGDLFEIVPYLIENL